MTGLNGTQFVCFHLLSSYPFSPPGPGSVRLRSYAHASGARHTRPTSGKDGGTRRKLCVQVTGPRLVARRQTWSVSSSQSVKLYAISGYYRRQCGFMKICCYNTAKSKQMTKRTVEGSSSAILFYSRHLFKFRLHVNNIVARGVLTLTCKPQTFVRL